jgi:hypothetical protein
MSRPLRFSLLPRPRVASTALFVGLLALPVAARAEVPSGSAAAMAEALFQQGRDLLKEKRYAEACARFEDSQRLDPKLGTLLNLAVCHETVGRFATAWAEYTSAATRARRDGQREREDFARGKAEALGQRLARVVIRVEAAVDGEVVTLDGKPLSGALLVAPLPLDPGEHTLAAVAPGRVSWSSTLRVPEEHAELTAQIPALAEAPTSTPTSAPPGGSFAAIPSESPPLASASGSSRAAAAKRLAAGEPGIGLTLIYTGFGASAVGLAVGVATGALALSRGGALETACPKHVCPASQQSALELANAFATGSNIGFGLAIVGTGVGIAGLFASRGESASGTRVGVFVGPSVVSVRGAF